MAGSILIIVLIFVVLFGMCLIKRVLLPKKILTHFLPDETPFLETRMTAGDHQVLIDVLKRVNQAFSENSIEYFIMSGTLLGAVRYQHRLPWDDDVDVGVDLSQQQKIESINWAKYGLEIRKVYFGYKVYDAQKNRRVMLEATFPFVDVFLMTELDGRIRFVNERARRMTGEAFDREDLYPLGTCTFAGLRLPCPGNVKKYLDEFYPKWDSLAYINGSHTGGLLFRTYVLPVNEETTAEIQEYLEKLDTTE